MLRVGTIASVLIMSVLLLVLPGCETRGKGSGGTSGDNNAVLKGDYFYVDFDRGVTATIAPDMLTRAGPAMADGMGMLVFGPGLGSPLPAASLAYRVDSLRRINGTSDEPGATTRGGDFFLLGDLDRDDDYIGMGIFSRAATSLKVSTLVDKATSIGTYHSVSYRMKRPGAEVASGTTTVTWKSDTTASWVMNLTRQVPTPLTRIGTLELASDGALISRDTVTGRNYVGFADPRGDWIVWAEVDAALGRVMSLDVLVREGSGLGDSTLNGRFNVVAYLEFNNKDLADTLFGNISFNGRGAYFDFQVRDSNGQQTEPNLTQQKYTVSGDGVVNFFGDITATGFVTRNASRRWLIVPESRADSSIRLYFAVSR